MMMLAANFPAPPTHPPQTAAAEMNENADGRHEGKEGHTSQSISKPQMSPPHHL